MIVWSSRLKIPESSSVNKTQTADYLYEKVVGDDSVGVKCPGESQTDIKQFVLFGVFLVLQSDFQKE